MYTYNRDFYDSIAQIIQDEKQIVPYILERVKPTSIVDFGCAEGRWLMEVKRIDSNIEVLGLDGEYVDKDRLCISRDEFMEADLRKRIELMKKYDLAISTEVAEHIEEEYADIFVDNLTRASDCILFSAAVPGQGGVHHVNEQWQSYWVEKFMRRGYEPDFAIRNYFWNNNNINAWRRQNIVMFSKKRGKDVYSDIVDVVHPGVLKECLDGCQETMGGLVRYMMLYPEMAEHIRGALEPLVEQKKKIIIYPYGANGRLCELMLTYLFRYDDFLIVDNKLGGREKKILTFDTIHNEYMNGIVLDVCANKNIHLEVLEQIRGCAAKMERITVFKI